MDTLQNKCVQKLLLNKQGNNPILVRMLERMINFNNLTDDVLIKLYYRFNDSNENIMNKMPERIKQKIDEQERYGRWLDNMTVGGAYEFDSSFDSDYDYETARKEYLEEYWKEEMERAQREQYDYNVYLEGVDEVNDQLYEQLNDWSVAYEHKKYEEDSYNSLFFFDTCYENIVHYSHLIAL